MSERKLKTAIMGLTPAGEAMLQCASGIAEFEIAAVCDAKSETGAKLAKQYECVFYDDYRQLLIQENLDCLIVTTGMHECEEHLRTALKKGIHILKTAPPGRSFEETYQLVKFADEYNVSFCVSNPVSCYNSFYAFRNLMLDVPAKHIQLVSGRWFEGSPPQESYQSDRELAGGGVLLYQGYALFHEFVSVFGMPQQVYCVQTSFTGDKKERQYVSEDIAVVSVKFNEISIGEFVASRSKEPIGPKGLLRVYYEDKLMQISRDQLTMWDQNDAIVMNQKYDDDEISVLKHDLEDFACSVLKSEEYRSKNILSRHLSTMATIEAAYVSSRTGMPEEPLRIGHAAENDFGHLWKTGNSKTDTTQ